MSYPKLLKEYLNVNNIKYDVVKHPKCEEVIVRDVKELKLTVNDHSVASMDLK